MRRASPLPLCRFDSDAAATRLGIRRNASDSHIVFAGIGRGRPADGSDGRSVADRDSSVFLRQFYKNCTLDSEGYKSTPGLSGREA